MRNKVTVNSNWHFLKDCSTAPASIPAHAGPVSLPHTWNAQDGQDGGADYYRGTCCYMKELAKPEGETVFLEFEAAASAARVYVNGQQVVSHEGGYSTFRADITEKLIDGKNLVAVLVDNSNQNHIYPQMADFTFYGGLYRDVNLITVPESHFCLNDLGGPGFTVDAAIRGSDAILTLHGYIEHAKKGQSVEFTIEEADGRMVGAASVPAGADAMTQLLLPDAHLWQGVEDPYLYTVTAKLISNNEQLDEVRTRFGVREFHADPQKGFFLNGKLTPLRGVSRHQDRLDIGNALSKEDHYEDAKLIREVGANTVRLAHYQHSQYFYDACDEMGLIVWAEIPFISAMNADPLAHDNCMSQMKELITQNYNHSSICFWGIANEITIGGESPLLVEHLKDLDRLVHELDKTRLSTMAHLSIVPMESEMNHLTDVVGYNHYFGWYGASMNNNETWLDKFHDLHPDIALGLSEYGAEGIITYHNDNPKIKDYSEEYQALYHEHMAQIISERDWLWGTHVWNMFDFGCDAREEGGVKGRNNKGLITLDRKIKKDAFYVYKAYWSQEEFVHLAGHRYSMRPGTATTIKAYSNLPKTALYVDGALFEEQEGAHIFVFEHVPLSPCTMISVKAGNHSDSMTVCQAAVPNPVYSCPMEDDGEEDGVANWFHLEDFKEVKPLKFEEGYYSIHDSMEHILKSEEAADVVTQTITAATGMKFKKSMMAMLKDLTVEGLADIMGDVQEKTGKTAEELLRIINELLSKIKK